MPAIRDEEWHCSPSIKRGIEILKKVGSEDDEGKGECVRFSGLVMGQEAANEEAVDELCDAIKQSRCKSVCLDWLNLNDKSLAALNKLSENDTKYMLDSFHLTMIDLSTEKKLEPVASLVSNNKHVIDLILTFCSINDGNIGLLGKALEVNEVILSLNLNFNLLKRAGFLTLAESLCRNNTLRYLEAKMNKAEKTDLDEFMVRVNENRTIEFLDLGQADDIDGNIAQNSIAELPKRKSTKKSLKQLLVTKDAEDPLPINNAANNAQAGGAQANNNNAPAPAEPMDLFSVVKRFVDRNKLERKERERNNMVGLLRDRILPNESHELSASLKHCKILFLGEKNCGKTFFAHCLVHQLYQTSSNSLAKGKRRLKTLSHARVTELGWTRISQFHHVDMILAKRLASEPSTIENREKANEVCFQFPEEVVITKNDLLKPSVLDREDEIMIREVEGRGLSSAREEAEVTPVFSESTKTRIIGRFSQDMEDYLDKGLRENNYPSFSLWDCDSPTGFDHFFRHFYNNHGLIFIFFSIEKMREDSESVIKSIKKYLQPIDLAKAEGKDFSSKVFIIGTYLDRVINDKGSKSLNEWVKSFDKIKNKKGLDATPTKQGHLNFLINCLNTENKKEDRKTLLNVKKMLLAFNIQLAESLGDKYSKEVISNDDDDLLFFPLGNNLPKSCERLTHDFDDISGINKFRAYVRKIIDSTVRNKKGEEESLVPVLRVMKSLRVAKIIDELITRASTKPENPQLKTDKYITYDEFQELAKSVGITAQSEILVILRYLDVTGIVSWKKANQTLEKMIILDPDYLINGLEKFYKAVGNPEDNKQFHTELDKRAAAKKIQSEVSKLREFRIVTGDLLYEELVDIENPSEYAFFKEFLTSKLHLNKLNVDVLKTKFAKQNLLEESWINNTEDADGTDPVDEEYYIVPFFDDVPNPKETLLTGFFKKLKLKYVPKNGIYSIGTFEKAFCSLLEAMDGGESIIGAKIESTENTVEYQKHLVRFKFGKEEITLSKQTSTEPNERNGFLQFEFGSESAVHLMMKFIESLFRKLSEDLVEGGAFNTFVLAENTWVDIASARGKKLSPYFDQKEKTVSIGDVIANFDDI